MRGGGCQGGWGQRRGRCGTAARRRQSKLCDAVGRGFGSLSGGVEGRGGGVSSCGWDLWDEGGSAVGLSCGMVGRSVGGGAERSGVFYSAAERSGEQPDGPTGPCGAAGWVV